MPNPTSAPAAKSPILASEDRAQAALNRLIALRAAIGEPPLHVDVCLRTIGVYLYREVCAASGAPRPRPAAGETAPMFDELELRYAYGDR